MTPLSLSHRPYDQIIRSGADCSTAQALTDAVAALDPALTTTAEVTPLEHHSDHPRR